MNIDKIANIIFAVLFGAAAAVCGLGFVQVIAEAKANFEPIAIIFGMLTAGMAFASGYQVFRFFVPNPYA